MNKVWILYGATAGGKEQTLGVYGSHEAVLAAQEKALWKNTELGSKKYDTIYWVDEEVQS